MIFGEIGKRINIGGVGRDRSRKGEVANLGCSRTEKYTLLVEHKSLFSTNKVY
jgi:hypothetical protein